MRLAIFAIAAALLLCAAPSFAAVDDAYTVNLLHFDGNISDESGTTWSAGGNAIASTTQAKFGSGALYVDGSGDYIVASDSADWAFGTASFTIDCQLYIPAHTSAYRRFMSQQSWPSVILARIDNANKLAFQCADSASVSMTDSGAFPVGQWVHVAITRDGSDWRIFRDGQLVANASSSADATDSTSNRYIGGEPSSVVQEYFSGYIDEFRVSKGVARWTNTFTPPTAAYGSTPAPAITSPVYLCSDGYLRFADGGRFYFK